MVVQVPATEPVRASGVLYVGVENDVQGVSEDMLRRKDLEQIQVVGQPVYVEHDAQLGAVGEIFDSWIDEQCRLHIGVEIYDEDQLGTDLSQAVARAMRGGQFRDFSLGLKMKRYPGGRVVQESLEASLVAEGKFAGTHITIRGSAAPDTTEPGSVLQRYIGTRDRKNHSLTVYGKPPSEKMSTNDAEINAGTAKLLAAVQQMQQTQQAPAPTPAAPPASETGADSLARQAQLVRTIEEQRTLLQAKETAESDELTQLRAEKAKLAEANAFWQAEQDKRHAAYRASQQAEVDTLVKLAKEKGIDTGKVAELMDLAASSPENNELWEIIKVLLQQGVESATQAAAAQAASATAEAAVKEQEEKFKRFQDNVAQDVVVQGSKRARTGEAATTTTTVDDMFVPATGAAVPKPPTGGAKTAAVKMPEMPIHYPDSMDKTRGGLYDEMMAAAASTSGYGAGQAADKYSQDLWNKRREYYGGLNADV